MRNFIIAIAVLAIAVLVARAPSIRADDKTGSGSSQGKTFSSSNKDDSGHDKAGKVTTTLSTGNKVTEKQPVYQDARKFPIAGTAGACWKGSDTTGTAGYQPDLTFASREVRVTAAKKKRGFWTATETVIMTYTASCHKRVSAAKEIAPVEPAENTSECSIYDAEGDEQIVGFTSTVVPGPSSSLFLYEVANGTDEDLDFEWPAVRTTSLPSGWSGTVSANSTTSLSFSASGTLMLVDGHGTDVTLTEEGDAITAHSSAAWCATSAVNIPDEPTNLYGTYMASSGIVMLGWTNNEVYDSIDVFRFGLDGNGHSFTIAGDSTSFIDEDAPLGVNEYMVVGVVDDIGSASNPVTYVVVE